MNDKKDGGYIYPQGKSVKDVSESTGGMALRDYFAGQALIALISKAPFIDRNGEFSEKQTQEYVCKYHADMCESAYCYSDAMLKERNR